MKHRPRRYSEMTSSAEGEQFLFCSFSFHSLVFLLSLLGKISMEHFEQAGTQVMGSQGRIPVAAKVLADMSDGIGAKDEAWKCFRPQRAHVGCNFGRSGLFWKVFCGSRCRPLRATSILRCTALLLLQTTRPAFSAFTPPCQCCRMLDEQLAWTQQKVSERPWQL